MTTRRLLLVLAALFVVAAGTAFAAPANASPARLNRNIWGPNRMTINPEIIRVLTAHNVTVTAWMPAAFDQRTLTPSGYGGPVTVGRYYESVTSFDTYWDAAGRGPTTDLTGQSPLKKTDFARGDADRVGIKAYAQNGIWHDVGTAGSSNKWYPGCSLRIDGRVVDQRDPLPVGMDRTRGDYAECFGYLTGH